MDVQYMNVQYLDKQLRLAGLPLVSVSDDGSFVLDNATPEQIDQAEAIVAAYNPLDVAKITAITQLNLWRGARRLALGLTLAEFQELVYTGKVLECQRWLAAPESAFGLALEAAARGIGNEAMAALVLGQWAAWQAASDQIEAAYITARAAVEAAADEAAVVAVLAGLE